MVTFQNEVIMEYSTEEIFKVFRETAKKDFPGFYEENPIGTFVERRVGAYSERKGKMKVRITDYKINSVYEITSTQGSVVYKSRYEFYPLSENKTKLLLIESQYTIGLFNRVNALVASIVFRGRIKKRFKFFIKCLEDQIEKNCNAINSY